VTRQTNLDRRDAARRWGAWRPPAAKSYARPATHCPKGHAFDEVNTYVHAKSGKRMCKTCANARYLRRKATAA
jgi:hypothetical protein